jgi:hypothetical protein
MDINELVENTARYINKDCDCSCAESKCGTTGEHNICNHQRATARNILSQEGIYVEYEPTRNKEKKSITVISAAELLKEK